MPKIVLIGAGSAIFVRRLLTDVMLSPELEDIRIGLMDIDPDGLAVAEKMVKQLFKAIGRDAPVQASTNRKEVLRGADYVINMIRVGGLDATIVDAEVPKKFGLKQTVADTCGVGGVMRGVRTLPHMLAMARDMEEVCPNATVLNYTNPMPMLSLGMTAYTPIRYIGLCHSVQGTSRQLAKYLDVPYDELDYLCGGINHMAWFIRLEHKGENLYPRLREFIKDPDNFMKDAVRFEIFRHMGYFHTESSIHAPEYNAFFMKDDALIERFKIPVEWFRGAIAGTRKTAAEFRAKLDRGEEMEFKKSNEYASQIIHSMETGQPRVIYGSVLNKGLIDNLPAHSAVEVPCLVGRNGVQPARVGALPPQCAAMNTTNILVHQLAARAVVERNRDHLYHALMFDPCTSSILNLDEIHQVVDEILEKNAQYFEGVFDA